MQDADFWLIRKGSDKTVGKPVKEFDPSRIGIKVVKTDIIDPNYLYYAMMNLHNQGMFARLANGTTNLVNITVNDIANISLGQQTESLNELAPSTGGEGDTNYLKTLARAWYNMEWEMLGDLVKQGKNPLEHRMKVQDTIENMLERGIHCPDGKVRKYFIGYNAEFDGVEIQSNEHYEYGDNDDAGNDIDSRTGKPWGPYDAIEFAGNELDESVAEATGDPKFDTMMNRMTTEPKYPDKNILPTSIPELIQWAEKNNKPDHWHFAQWANKNKFTNVNDALEWFGDNVDPTNEWGPKDPDSPWDGEWLEDAAKHDPKAAELLRIYHCYENIVFDWSDDYRQMNMPDPFKDKDLEETSSPVDQAAVDALQKKHGWSTGRTSNGDLYFTWQGRTYVFYGERMRITLSNDYDNSVSVVWGMKPNWQGRGNNELSFAQAVEQKLLKFDLSIWQQLDRRQINDSQALQKFKQENERQAREAIAQGVTEGKERYINMKIEEVINEDWQKVNKKDKTSGMSRKAVKAYRRENPGSKLKTAVTTKPSKLKKGSKAANRRKSFCARMSGMKKSRASAKTKRDPDSPINKALRRWNCESVEQMQKLVMIAEQKIRNLKK